MRLGIFFAIIATTFAGEVYEDFNPSDAILTPPIAEGFNLTDDLLIVNKRQFVPVAPSILRPVLSEWPLKTFSPYLDIISWPVLNAAQIAKSQGIFNFKLAFIVADANNAPSWGGTVPISHYAQQIREIRALRGNVAVSFGGSAGTYVCDARR